MSVDVLLRNLPAMYLKYLISALASGAALVALAFGLPRAGVTSIEGNKMKQSVTYLYLLAKTPFFTRLDRDQLKWVIAHSTEWEADAGTEISNRIDAAEHVWVLLDGGWQLEQGGRIYEAGHADAAKWYGGAQAEFLPSNSRLIANKHSYIMRIRSADFDKMQQMNFDFTEHLRQGMNFYRQASIVLER